MVKSSEHLYLLSTRVYPQLLQQRTEEFYLERLIMQLSGANGDSPWPAIRTMPTRQWSSVASHTPRAAGDPANRWNGQCLTLEDLLCRDGEYPRLRLEIRCLDQNGELFISSGKIY